jgi:hypothetical protein
MLLYHTPPPFLQNQKGVAANVRAVAMANAVFSMFAGFAIFSGDKLYRAYRPYRFAPP